MEVRSPQTNKRLARWGLWLVAGTLAYNVVEAVIALWAGSEAGSIALLGFGLDSVIEVAAAAAMLWRLSVELRGEDPEHIEQAERRVRRVIGATFLALAAYVTVQAAYSLLTQGRPEESLVGIILAIASLIIMPLLAWGKLRVARGLGSEALRAEAKETIACAYLSLALLVGLVLNAALGWWWADPAVALLMVPWLVFEGVEGWRGEDDRKEKGP
jgi:divalent metal cation (Fe/Co/Zn/Cd) transporter